MLLEYDRGACENVPCADACRLADVLAAVCLYRTLGRGRLSGRRAEEIREEAERFHRDSWRLKRDLDEVLTDEVRAELKKLINHFEANRAQYRRSFLLWIDLIEDLTLDAERDLGDGTGPLKLRRVKAAMFHLIFSFAEPVRFPGIPRYVQPLVLNLGVRWTVEFIVGLVNTPEPDLSLWGNTPVTAGRPRRGRLLRVQSRVWAKTVEKRESLLQWLVEVLVGWSLRPPKLSRDLRRKVEAITSRWGEDPSRPPIKQLADAIFLTLRWIGTHGKEMRAAVDAVGIAVHWTAEFAEMDEDERIELIKDAMILYFEDLGLKGVLFERIISVILDLAVESVIHLFRKREVSPA